MDDLRKHTFNNKVWIPLYAAQSIDQKGEIGKEGYQSEYFGAHSIVVSKSEEANSLSLEWMDLNNSNGHRPWIDEEGVFHSTMVYDWKVQGEHLVLIQYIEIERKRDVHINSDLILGLGLSREGDIWVCPEEDFVEVIKLTRDDDKTPNRVDIKAEFLKDYLCASNSGLRLLTYQSRQSIEESFTYLDWAEKKEETMREESFYWSGRLLPVFEDSLFGESVFVSHSGRTDTDYQEDIPVYEFPTDENTFHHSWTVKPKGKRLQRAMGEIWKKEWIAPAIKSPRVRGDEISSRIEFIVDNQGNKETSDTLAGPSRWLWFHPNIVNDLLKKRTGTLSWYTENTGDLGGAWNRSVHFGVNSLGLINVYAKDIAQLPEFDKKTWANQNTSPDGKVSEELLMSQMQAMPASTVAPEEIFFSLIKQIQEICKARMSGELFREHTAENAIARNIHRFQATSLDGFYFLCKEITRFLIERIDFDFLKTLKKEDEKIGSLKRVERILTALGYDGRAIMGALAGVYDLRIADAHLPSNASINDSLKLVGVDYEQLKFKAGFVLLQNVNISLEQIKSAFEQGDMSKLK